MFGKSKEQKEKEQRLIKEIEKNNFVKVGGETQHVEIIDL